MFIRVHTWPLTPNHPRAAQIWYNKIMVTKYLRAAMRGAKYELLEEGGYYGCLLYTSAAAGDAA